MVTQIRTISLVQYFKLVRLVIPAIAGIASACVPATVAKLSESSTSTAAANVVEVRNGRWYDGSGFNQRTFYIADGILRTDRPARVDSTIDLEGGFVIPPFGDAHTHNLDGPFNIEKVRDAYIREGTFYVAVLTNTATGAERVRSQFDDVCSPDVIYANGGLTSTLSHPFLAYEPRAMNLQGSWDSHADSIRKSRLRENNAYWFIDTSADLDAKWPSILAAKPGILKIFLLDALESPPAVADSGLPHGHGLRPSLVPEIVRRAHAAGLRVAAHVETARDFAIAVKGGVDLMAHMPGYAYGIDDNGRAEAGVSPGNFEIDEATAREAGRRGLAVTPTLSWTYNGTGPDSVVALAARHALMSRNIERLETRGVKFLIGSDSYGRTAWHEVDAMRRFGTWSDAEILRMWAVETPAAIFPARKIGRLEPGYEASFLVLKENPLSRFDAVTDISLRVKQGCILSPPG